MLTGLLLGAAAAAGGALFHLRRERKRRLFREIAAELGAVVAEPDFLEVGILANGGREGFSFSLDGSYGRFAMSLWGGGLPPEIANYELKDENNPLPGIDVGDPRLSNVRGELPIALSVLGPEARERLLECEKLGIWLDYGYVIYKSRLHADLRGRAARNADAMFALARALTRRKPGAGSLLEGALRDPLPAVRERCAAALLEHHPDARETDALFRSLVPAPFGPAPWRTAARLALAETRPAFVREATIDEVRAAMTVGGGGLTRRLVRALIEEGPATDRLLSQVVGGLAEDVARLALEALAARADVSVVEALRALDRADLRRDVHETIRRIQSRVPLAAGGQLTLAATSAGEVSLATTEGALSEPSKGPGGDADSGNV